MNMEKLGVGIIGCGNISSAYLRLGPLFKALEVRAVADLDRDAAKARAKEFNVRAESVEDLLAAKDIDVIVNLTIPDAHFAVTKSILEAGKHAYSEKPLVLTLAEGEQLRGLADGKGLRVGSAPDTFLGGAHQLARAKIDEGLIGDVVAGTCHVMSHGMEHWHPNPDFFFQPGAGPVLDVGPYYVTNLIQLIGPVKRVAALATAATPTRTISTQCPRKGEKIPVETPTNIHALLDFASGATITLSASWDVWAHRHANMELYGKEGSLFVPDPNFFGGTVEHAGHDGKIAPLAEWDHPFGIANEGQPARARANYRTAGLADMAQAIVEDRPHRCSLGLAVHAVDVMTSILKSGESGTFIELTTSCDRPAALSPDAARKLLD
jgi:predicted dehydrogenase